MKKIIKFVLFIFIITFSTRGAFALQAGISMDYAPEIDENVIYSSPIDFISLPNADNNDLAYFIRFKPLNMLSASEIAPLEHSIKVRANRSASVPSVYNISFANGGKLQYESKVPSIEELIRKNPKRAEYIYVYAVQLKNQGKLSDAINQIDKALRLDYNYALGHFLKGDILRNMGNFKAAAKEYVATIQINPYCTDAYFNIAKMLEIYGNSDLALNYYKMAYSVSPNDLEIRNQILKLSRKIGQI